MERLRIRLVDVARILSFSKDRGLIASNPCEGGGRFYTADGTDKV